MICKCFFPFVSHLFTLWIVSFDTQKLGARACCRMLMLSHFSCVWLCATLWTAACQVPLSMGFSRQEYWSGLPCPFPGDLPNQWMEPLSQCLLHCQVGSLPLAPPGKPVGFNTQHLKRNVFESVLMRWMNLEPTTQSEISQKDKTNIVH